MIFVRRFGAVEGESSEHFLAGGLLLVKWINTINIRVNLISHKNFFTYFTKFTYFT